MLSPKTRIAIASALTAVSLGACVSSDGPPAIDPGAPRSIAVTLPAAPAGITPCLRQAFPEIPDSALSKADVVRIIGAAKVLDRAKTACGERAVRWIEAVRRDFAR